MQISVTSDIDKLIKGLHDLKAKQLPYATMIAMNNVATYVKTVEEREIKTVFDRPTRYTQNSLWIKWARKHKLEAMVYLKDEATKGTPAEKYLGAQITGSPRKHKGFEKLLINKGMMPGNMYAMPSRTVKRDSFGNVSQGLIVSILSGLQAQRDINQRATKGSKTFGRYFAGIISGVHGIWDVKALHNGGPALLFIYTRAPNYTRRLRFVEIGNRAVADKFPAAFNAALRNAMATAR